MQRATLIERYETEIVAEAKKRFQLDPGKLDQFESYEGCENLVYACQRQNQPVIFRISYRPDRSFEQIMGEVDYIHFLGQNGVRAAQPILSVNGSFVEPLSFQALDLFLACFERGKGMRVPDNHYRYRQDAPIEEYFQNWGKILGQLHALSQRYQVKDPRISRPDWFQLHAKKLNLDATIPEDLSLVRNRVEKVLQMIKTLSKGKEGYGLIHGDFNDGNFTVDYTNGNLTVFDFDDSCYFWFAYELASAWEGGIGRAMFEGLEARKCFMNHYMDCVFRGYSEHNQLPQKWIDRIPLFIKLIQVEELLHYLQYYRQQDEDIQPHLRYLIKCIEGDLPYMGFFDSVYNPERPFKI